MTRTLALLLLLTSAAHAQQRAACGPTAAIAKELEDEYHEHPVVMGLRSDGQFMQLYSSAEGASWTLIITSPSGVSCLQGAGKGLEIAGLGDPT